MRNGASLRPTIPQGTPVTPATSVRGGNPGDPATVKC